MILAVLGASTVILVMIIKEYAQQLVQDQLSGTSKNNFIDIGLGGFLGGCLASSFSLAYPIGYGIFFTLLGITLFTDTWVMLISRYVTLYTIPLALSLTIMTLLPLSLTESLFGALCGFILLTFIARSGRSYFKQEALGQGDIDLLAMIGAFTGWQGCWFALCIGSIIGSFFGLILIFKNRTSTLHTLQLPFGTFLAMGSMLYVIYAKNIYTLLLIN